MSGPASPDLPRASAPDAPDVEGTRRTLRPVLALALGLVAGGLAACPSGLPLQAGNAYRCDFADAGPAERDLQCPAGWICGVGDRCQPFDPEEIWPCGSGPCSYPSLETAAAGAQYPLLPAAPVQAVGTVTNAKGTSTGLEVAYRGDRSVHAVDFACYSISAEDSLPPQVSAPGVMISFGVESGPLLGRIFLDTDGGTLFSEGEGAVTRQGGGALNGATALRHFAPVVRILGATSYEIDQTALVLLRDGPPLADADAGWTQTRVEPGILLLEASRPQGPWQPVFRPFELPAGLRPRDARVAIVRRGLVPTQQPVVNADEGVFLRCRDRSDSGDAGCELASGGTEGWQKIAEPLAAFRAGALYPSSDRQLWAMVADRIGPNLRPQQLLALRALGRAPDTFEPALNEVFGPCVPCGSAALTHAIPFARSGGGVDVLCEDAAAEGRPLRSVVRVVGASGDRCLTAPVTLQYDPNAITFIEDSVGGLALLGGAHGQLWLGETLAEAAPLFLERAPIAVTRLGDRLLALTPQSLAVEVPGFGMLTVPSEEGRPVGLIHNAPGHFLLPSGNMVKLLGTPSLPEGNTCRSSDPDAGVPAGDPIEYRFGPPLLSPSGTAASGPFLGEAIFRNGALSLVATALDNLYFRSDVRFDDPLPDPTRGLTPQVTPEPNFPIRSLAVDRSARTAPDGPLLTLGYLVTSRSLFEFALDRAALRWDVRELEVAPGEPAAVAMLTPEVDRARVLYRDGRIFSLPNGYPVTPPIQREEEAARVIGFQNPRGLSVALTDKGVFMARPDAQPANPDAGERYRLWHWERVEVPGHDGGFEFGHLAALPPTDQGGEPDALYFFDGRGGVYLLGRVSSP